MVSSPSSPIAERPLPFIFADHLVLDESPTRDFYKDLLRGLAHKNNNVLAVVQGFSSLILMTEGLDESTVESVQQMRDSAQHSSNLSERILTAGGCARISPQAINLADFLPLLESNFSELCKAAGSHMTLTVSQKASAITADTSRFKELLMELVRNAAEDAAKVSDGWVEVSVLDPGTMTPMQDSRIDIIVRNNGPGIPDERLGEIFRPFMTTKGSQHFGIGLTTAGVLAGQMRMRLGIASVDGVTTAWLTAPTAL